MQARDAAKRTRAAEVDDDGDQQYGKGPERGQQRKMVVQQNAAEGLVDDPDAGGEHDAGLDEGCKRFHLAVAVVVLFVGGTVGNLDGEEGDGRGDEVDGGVGRLAQHSQRSGEQASDQLKQCDDRGGGNRKGRGGALRGVGMMPMVSACMAVGLMEGCYRFGRRCASVCETWLGDER